MAWDDKYVTESGGGAQDGTSVANAWAFVADFAAIKAHLAGSDDRILLCYGGTPWTPGQIMTWDNTSGTAAARNCIQGANASGVVDGTACIIDGESGAFKGFDVNTNYIICRDIILQNYGATAWDVVGSKYSLYDRVQGNSGTIGFQGGGSNFCAVVDSQFNSNSVGGIYNPRDTLVLRCTCNSNTGSGIYSHFEGDFLWNICSKNTDHGINMPANHNVALHNICDDNTNGNIQVGTGILTPCVAYNKLTNSSSGYGLGYDASSSLVVYQDFNSFYNNSLGEVNYNGGFSDDVGDNDVSLGDDYYTDETTGDYTTSNDDPSIEMQSSVGDSATNIGYIPCQFPPQNPSATTPTFAGFTGSQMCTDGTLRLSWSAGSDVTFYIVYINTASLTYANSEVAGIIPTGNTSCVVKQYSDGADLVPGTTYNYAVRAINISQSNTDSNTVTGSYNAKGRGGSPLYIKNVAGL